MLSRDHLAFQLTRFVSSLISTGLGHGPYNFDGWHVAFGNATLKQLDPIGCQINGLKEKAAIRCLL